MINYIIINYVKLSFSLSNSMCYDLIKRKIHFICLFLNLFGSNSVTSFSLLFVHTLLGLICDNVILTHLNFTSSYIEFESIWLSNKFVQEIWLILRIFIWVGSVFCHFWSYFLFYIIIKKCTPYQLFCPFISVTLIAFHKITEMDIYFYPEILSFSFKRYCMYKKPSTPSRLSFHTY